MSRLDELLLIPDRLERIKALKDYAHFLKLDIGLAKNNQGDYTEEKLVILIFDAEHHIKHEQTHTYHFLSATVVLATVILALIIIFPKVVASIYEPKNSIRSKPTETLRAYDKKGKPIVQDGQPVLFELMDGVYQEFDEKGRLQYEYLYRKGMLLSKKEYDERGQLLGVHDYQEPQPAAP